MTGMHRRLKDLSENEKEGKITFGFVRNPWDRMVSMYHFRSQKPVHKRFNQAKLKELGFVKALMNDEIGPNQNIDQCYWLNGVDYVLRFEDFDAEIDKICKIIGITHKPIERLNPSIHDEYRKYYTDAAIDHVAANHKKTIERFGYSF
jgi:hypothetical protein